MGFESETGAIRAEMEKDFAQRAKERAELAHIEQFEEEVIEPLKKQAISSEAFVGAGVMKRADVDTDNAHLAEYKASDDYEKSDDYEAKVVEFVLQKMFEDGIFGDTVKYAIKTTEYDDTVRGVDFYVDIGEGEERVLVGIDATVSKDPKVLARKIERNLSAANRGVLPAVKYYMDIDGNLIREKTMPRVILGLDRETTLRLRDALLENPVSLEDDVAVKRLIEQMIGQLDFLYNLSRHKPNAQKKYARALQRLDEMCIEKGLELDDLAQAFKDDVLANPQRLVSRVSASSSSGRRSDGDTIAA